MPRRDGGRDPRGIAYRARLAAKLAAKYKRQQDAQEAAEKAKKAAGEDDSGRSSRDEDAKTSGDHAETHGTAASAPITVASQTDVAASAASTASSNGSGGAAERGVSKSARIDIHLYGSPGGAVDHIMIGGGVFRQLASASAPSTAAVEGANGSSGSVTLNSNLVAAPAPSTASSASEGGSVGGVPAMASGSNGANGSSGSQGMKMQDIASIMSGWPSARFGGGVAVVSGEGGERPQGGSVTINANSEDGEMGVTSDANSGVRNAGRDDLPVTPPLSTAASQEGGVENDNSGISSIEFSGAATVPQSKEGGAGARASDTVASTDAGRPEDSEIARLQAELDEARDAVGDYQATIVALSVSNEWLNNPFHEAMPSAATNESGVEAVSSNQTSPSAAENVASKLAEAENKLKEAEEKVRRLEEQNEKLQASSSGNGDASADEDGSSDKEGGSVSDDLFPDDGSGSGAAGRVSVPGDDGSGNESPASVPEQPDDASATTAVTDAAGAGAGSGSAEDGDRRLDDMPPSSSQATSGGGLLDSDDDRNAPAGFYDKDGEFHPVMPFHFGGEGPTLLGFVPGIPGPGSLAGSAEDGDSNPQDTAGGRAAASSAMTVATPDNGWVEVGDTSTSSTMTAAAAPANAPGQRDEAPPQSGEGGGHPQYREGVSPQDSEDEAGDATGDENFDDWVDVGASHTQNMTGCNGIELTDRTQDS